MWVWLCLRPQGNRRLVVFKAGSFLSNREFPLNSLAMGLNRYSFPPSLYSLIIPNNLLTDDDKVLNGIESYVPKAWVARCLLKYKLSPSGFNSSVWTGSWSHWVDPVSEWTSHLSLDFVVELQSSHYMSPNHRPNRGCRNLGLTYLSSLTIPLDIWSHTMQQKIWW